MEAPFCVVFMREVDVMIITLFVWFSCRSNCCLHASAKDLALGQRKLRLTRRRKNAERIVAFEKRRQPGRPSKKRIKQ